MRKYIRYRLRCAARAAGVKPSTHVRLGWDELQIHRVGYRTRQIHKAIGRKPKRLWSYRIRSVL